MKLVEGIWLPDSDTHFSEHLIKGSRFQNAGTYQYNKIMLAMAQCSKYNGAIDVGAHVGLWSRVLSHYFTNVLAFEPVPDHIECFKKNIDTLIKKNVVLIPMAAGSDKGTVRINPVVDNTGNARVDNIGIEVEMVKLDNVISTSQLPGHVDFIKIDVEGYEYDVVKGAEQSIKRNRPVMVIEQKPGHAKRYGLHDRAAVDLVLSWGAKLAWERSGDYCLTWPKQ